MFQAIVFICFALTVAEFPTDIIETEYGPVFGTQYTTFSSFHGLISFCDEIFRKIISDFCRVRNSFCCSPDRTIKMDATRATGSLDPAFECNRVCARLSTGTLEHNGSSKFKSF